MGPRLIVVGGLPGTGKTTVARELATRLGAAYLRIDVIEQAIRAAGGAVGPVGYAIGNALAVSNLALGRSVIADCVNPVPASRDGWRAAAARAAAALVEVELVCSDAVEHRRRVEARRSDIEGLVPPTWQDVVQRDYAPWPEPHLVIDTAAITPEQAVATLERQLG